MFRQRREMCPILDLVSVPFAELDDLHEVLLRQYGACAVDNLAGLRFQKVQTLLEYNFLNLSDLLDTVKGELPAEVGITSHYPGAGTGYVQHDPVTLLVQGLFKLGFVVMHLAVLDSGPFQPLFCLD